MGSIAETEPAAPQTVVRPPTPPPFSASPPRILIIGAGSRGHTYARAVRESTNGIVVAVCEPISYKLTSFIQTHIPHTGVSPPEGTSFASWTDFVAYETARRARVAASEPEVPLGVDAAFVCVQDKDHRAVVEALSALGGIHVMCEKPLATRLGDCIAMYRSLTTTPSPVVFSIGHVLRYSPHNALLRQLLLHERAIGDVLSVNHTEPVGWWHFAHSYVRGNWRRADTSAPSLLTESCHDIDILLWLLCSPAVCADGGKAHLPRSVSSTGSLQMFRKARKPLGAGAATNCLQCPVEENCKFSAKRIYVGSELKGVGSGNANWPVNIVLPEIEDMMKPNKGEPDEAKQKRLTRAQEALLQKLAEDYDENTPEAEIAGRNWFGRCVFESDNDVSDNEVVTITWDDDISSSTSAADSKTNGISDGLDYRGAKTATFHMVSNTTRICDRFTHIYGTDGEIVADSNTITVDNFSTGEKKTYHPKVETLGHGGGDNRLAQQFVMAVDKVKNHGWDVDKAQRQFVACTLDEVLRSHAMVFCAEEARKLGRTVDWSEWWQREVEGPLAK